MKAGIAVINIDLERFKDAKKAAGIDLAIVSPDSRTGTKSAGEALAMALVSKPNQHIDLSHMT